MWDFLSVRSSLITQEWTEGKRSVRAQRDEDRSLSETTFMVGHLFKFRAFSGKLWDKSVRVIIRDLSKIPWFFRTVGRGSSGKIWEMGIQLAFVQERKGGRNKLMSYAGLSKDYPPENHLSHSMRFVSLTVVSDSRALILVRVGPTTYLSHSSM